MNRDDYLNSAMNAQPNSASEEYRNRSMNQSTAYYSQIAGMMNSTREIIDYKGSRLSIEYNHNYRDLNIEYRVHDLATGFITHSIREWVNTPRDLIPDVIQEHIQLVRRGPDYQHPGPTNRELSNHQTLAQAWEEYQIILPTLGS